MRGWFESAAGIDDEPGSAMPSASVIAIMVAAVPITMQVPDVGMSWSCARPRSGPSSVPAVPSPAHVVTSPASVTLSREVERRFARGETGVMDFLSRDFEKLLISRALVKTGGRRIEAANLLGIGRNTITRKIQELGLE